MQEGSQGNSNKENLKTEIVSVRLAEKKNHAECLNGIAPCIFEFCFPPGLTDTAKLIAHLKQVGLAG